MENNEKFIIGNEAYDRNHLINTLYNSENALLYMDNLKMGKKDRLAFELARGLVLKAIKDGKVSEIDLQNTLLDPEHSINSPAAGWVVDYIGKVVSADSSSKLKYKEKEKAKYNRDLDDDFAEYFNAGKQTDENFANAFIDKDLANENGERSTANRAKAYSEMLLKKLARLKNGEFDTTDINVDEEARNLQDAINALADGVVSDDEIATLAKAGHNSAATKILFGKGNVSATGDKWAARKKELKESGMSDEQITRLILAEQLNEFNKNEDAVKQAEELNTNYHNQDLWEQYKKSHYGGSYNPRVMQVGKYNMSRNEYEKYLKAGWDPQSLYKAWIKAYIANPNATVKNKAGQTKRVLDYLLNFLAYAADDRSSKLKGEVFALLKDGKLLLPDSINYETGTALAYDPKTFTLHEINPNTHEDLRPILYNKWLETNGLGISSWKEGGVLKFLEGGEITLEQIQQLAELGNPEAQAYLLQLTLLQSSPKFSNNLTRLATILDNYHPGGYNLVLDILALARAKKAAESKKALLSLKDRAAKNGRTVEQQKAGERKIVDSKGNIQFTGREYWDMANMAADVTSMIAAWVPGYGTAVSAALGIGSTGSKLVKDLTDDSMSTWDALKGATVGLALDTVGLIPGLGTTSKTAKIVKTATKLAPTLLAAYGTVTEFKPALDALQKLTSKEGKDLTLDEWKHIGNFLTSIAGANRAAASHVKTKIMAGAAKGESTTNYSVKGLDGKDIKLTKEQFAEIKKLSSDPEAALKYLDDNNISGKLATSKGWKFWKDGKPIVKTSESINNPNSNWFAPYDLANPTASQVGLYANPTGRGFLGINSIGRRLGLNTDYEIAASLHNWNNPLSIKNLNSILQEILNPQIISSTLSINTRLQGKSPLKSSTKIKPILSPLNYTLRMNPLSGNLRILRNGFNAVTGKSYHLPTILDKTSLGFGFKQGGRLQAIETLKSFRPSFQNDNLTIELSKMEKGGILKVSSGARLGELDTTKYYDPNIFLYDKDEKSNLAHNVTPGTLRRFNTLSRVNWALDALKNNKINADLINDMQARHYGLYKSSDLNTGFNHRVLLNDAVKNYLTLFLDYGLNDAIIKPDWENNYTITSPKPTSNDKADSWTADGLYGLITDDRRILARKGDYASDEDYLKHKKLFEDAGYDYYLDTPTGYYMLKHLQKDSTPDVQTNPTYGHKASTNKPSTSSKIKDALGLVGNIISKMDPSLPYELGNYFLHSRANKRINLLLRNSIKPVLEPHFNSHLSVFRDITAEQEALKLAGMLNTIAGRPKTSDSGLAAAIMLEALNKGAQLIDLANLVSNQRAHETEVRSTANEIENAKYNLGVSYRNATAINVTNKAKADILAQYLSTLATNLDNLLKKGSLNALLKKADLNAFNLLLLRDKYARYADNNPKYKAGLKEYLDLRSKYSSETDPTKKASLQKEVEAKYEELKNLYESLTNEALTLMNQQYATMMGLRFSPIAESKTYTMYAKGGKTKLSDIRIKARIAENKEFNKIIQNSIKNHYKLVDNMSKGTLLAIKKALNL